jgi:hypothetical protein
MTQEMGEMRFVTRPVGWVERSETHRDIACERWVSQELNPSSAITVTLAIAVTLH